MIAGRFGLGGIAYLLQLVTEIYDDNLVTWQWLLGRLYVIENLLMDFPTEFVPRFRPDGASSDGSLEQMGATAADELDEPHLYERLLIIAEFSIKAVSYSHARISRVARRVFLLTARYAAHMENLCKELMELLNELDFAHKKSLKRQFEKILVDYHQSDKILHELRLRSSTNTSPSESPVSTPRCNSPVTTMSDHHSDAGSATGKASLPVPPNTPIKERRKRLKEYEIQRRSFDFVEEESDKDSFVGQSNKFSKSLDDLESIDRPKRSIKRYTKRVRSRSKTPQKIGPVLETNLDDVIRQQEEQEKINSSMRSVTYGGDETISNQSVMTSQTSFTHPDDLNGTFSPIASHPPTPIPRLLSHNLETDIDSVELDLNAITMPGVNGIEDINSSNTLKGNSLKRSLNHSAPTVFPKVPDTLSLNLSAADESPRPISPCAHVKELERLSAKKSKSPPPNMSCSLSVTCTPCTLVSKKLSLPLKNVRRSTDYESGTVTKDTRKSPVEVSKKISQLPSASQTAQLTDDLSEISPVAKYNEKPVTFKSEVASATPKQSPSHTLDKGKNFFCIIRTQLFFFRNTVERIAKWASSWDYGTFRPS